MPTTIKASANCENPTTQLNDSIMVIGYRKLARGSDISFSCRLGLILIGPKSSTCMGNGEWEPDPREVQCKIETEYTGAN